jgi:hypothetical protein
MTEDQLRAMIREVVARQLGQAATPPVSSEPFWKSHPSHRRLPVLSGRQGDGPCLVEPVVTCHHCGFCQSFGH